MIWKLQSEEPDQTVGFFSRRIATFKAFSPGHLLVAAQPRSVQTRPPCRSKKFGPWGTSRTCDLLSHIQEVKNRRTSLCTDSLFSQEHKRKTQEVWSIFTAFSQQTFDFCLLTPPLAASRRCPENGCTHRALHPV
jgi:hypothetical protein